MSVAVSAEITGLKEAVSLLSEMNRDYISLHRDEAELRDLKEMASVTNILNSLIMQHFGQGAAELTIKFEDLEIEKESV